MRKATAILIIALAAAWAYAETTFTSADGAVTVTAQDDGTVIGPNGKAVLTLAADGSATRADGTYVGKFVGNTAYDKDGVARVTIEADGTIVARREVGKLVGTDVYDAHGELIGTVSDTSDVAKQLALMALRRGKGGPGPAKRGPGGPPPQEERGPEGPPPAGAAGGW